MAAPMFLSRMRVLKAEEKKTSDILDILKSQLTKLKVEELVLSSKIRELKVIHTVNPATMPPTSSSQNEDKTKESLADSEEVNRESLDLTPGSSLLEKLAAGGAAILQNRDEEMEEDDEDDDKDDENNADLFSRKDILTNFLE